MTDAERLAEENQRFWRRVKKLESGCWEWQGGKFPTGYGHASFRWQGKIIQRAHRLAWLLTHGSLSKLFVLHKCDNPPCVNPDHLFQGNQHVNMADAIRKGRLYSKLSDEDVAMIRERVAKGGVGEAWRVSLEYGVTNSSISKIVRGILRPAQVLPPLADMIVDVPDGK
jgi:hypothetical protein